METTPFAETSIEDSDPAALRRVYLQRLERLLRLRQRHERELNRQGTRLLDHSVFAAYCDCRLVGADEEARALLQRMHVTIDPEPRQLRLTDAADESWPEARASGQ
jgi:hypothetical protein